MSTGLAVWATRAQGLLRLLSVRQSILAHQIRTRLVQQALALVLLLVVAEDRLAGPCSYKNLVFGEGGLVEWSQVLVLVLASRTAWLMAADLECAFAGTLPRGCSSLALHVLPWCLMEELAWGQVIFGWRTLPLLNEINAQNETTLHNIGWFQERLDLGTFLVTLAVLAVVVLAPRLMAARPKTVLESMAVCSAFTHAVYVSSLAAVSGGFCTCVLHGDAHLLRADPQSGSGVG